MLLLLLASSWGLLLLGGLPLAAHARCVVRLELDPAASTFSLSGDNSLVAVATGVRIPGAVTETPPQVKGISGAIYGVAASLAACPATPDAWREALPSFAFTTQVSKYDATPLRVYPPVLLATTASFPFQPRGLALHANLTLLGGPAASGGGSSVNLSFRAGMTVAVAEGVLYSSSPITGDRLDSLTNVSGIATVTQGVNATVTQVCAEVVLG